MNIHIWHSRPDRREKMSFFIENILKTEPCHNKGKSDVDCCAYTTGRDLVQPIPIYSYDRGTYASFEQWQKYRYYYDLYYNMKDPNHFTSGRISQSSFSFHSNLNIYSKKKGGQVRFSLEQTEVLEQRFSSHKYLSPEDRKCLAKTLNLSDRQVKTWFQNRRAKWRRSQLIESNENLSLKFELEDHVNEVSRSSYLNVMYDFKK
ncbi:homeobox protein EMX2 [Harmonia axyridis]|uniref:homeobox protein EMX2 n=1 Tax=Harmonia axyridis TaxID=115357 RepID=UPI001E279223|nr:homeobox protein EMX2 [Harmonia axyridis]